MSALMPPVAPAPAHHAAGATYHGGDADGDDGDDPRRRPKRLPSAHEVDAPPGAGSRMKKVWRRCRRPEGVPNISEPCPVCSKRFWSSKALHGHMRTHPGREWRGVLPPEQRQPKKPSQEKEVARSLIILSEGPNARQRPEFKCMCGRKFDSRQALGGHRASHRSVRGCCAIARAKGEGSKNVAAQKNKSKEKLEEESATEKKEDKADASQAQTSRKGKEVVIDLNMPAPEDDESSPEIDLNRKLEE